MKENFALRDEMINFFLEKAQKIGAISLKYFNNLKEEEIFNKEGHLHDPLTKADLEISDYIVNILKPFEKNIILLTEETSKSFKYSKKELLKSKKPILIIDELDGTLNFSKGNENFSIIFGMAEQLENDYEMTVGMIYKPLTNEFYFASIDKDSLKISSEGIKTKLKVSKRKKMVSDKSSVNVAIGRKTFPLDYPKNYNDVADVMERFMQDNSSQIRKNSKYSCGLEVMDIANGNVDAYLIAKAANWDYAASSLILKQAGGEVYIAKSKKQLLKPKLWTLQLEQPSKYYPAIFTNKSIDNSLFKNLEKYVN